MSQVIALLSALCSVVVFIGFTQLGKIPEVADLMYLGNVLVFGVVTDKLSVLIGMAFVLVGFLIVVYSTGYLTPQNREHPKKKWSAVITSSCLLLSARWPEWFILPPCSDCWFSSS